MRTLAIATKVMKELFCDKRTLAMMFIAPIFIMWLMNLMFSANTSVDVNLATVNISSSVVKTLDKVDSVSTDSYDKKSEAMQALKDEKVDGVIVADKDGNYTVTYANTDASKTSVTRQALRSAVTSSNTQTLLATVKKVRPQVGQEATAKVNIDEKYAYGDKDTNFFSKMLPILIGFNTFFFVFLISGMALLKERTSGTLDRLLATPVKRSEIVFGYMLSYGIIAAIQSTIIVLSTVWLLDLEVVGSIVNVIIVSVVLALVALAFGILLSTLAKSEFQMMQFIPLIIMPQLFFSGLISLEAMGDWAVVIGKFLPLTYSGEALNKIILHGADFSSVIYEILILLAFLAVLTVLNIVGLRRYRKV
ncbi:ABC transporter permease [Streptococcus dentapri]|uniref:ABC transporter permease n=1 Tax=Streptococcus dentapri TaxID=573564 RepID=A0ABV8CZY0_9STRE